METRINLHSCISLLHSSTNPELALVQLSDVLQRSKTWTTFWLMLIVNTCCHTCLTINDTLSSLPELSLDFLGLLVIAVAILLSGAEARDFRLLSVAVQRYQMYMLISANTTSF